MFLVLRRDAPIVPICSNQALIRCVDIVMDRVWFHPPVPICFPDWVGTTIHVGNVAQATGILLRLWPVEPGQKHRVAREVCLAALEDPAKAGIARQAFQEAAEEAGMLVE